MRRRQKRPPPRRLTRRRRPSRTAFDRPPAERVPSSLFVRIRRDPLDLARRRSTFNFPRLEPSMRRLAALCVILSLGLFLGCGDEKTKTPEKTKTKTPEKTTVKEKTTEKTDEKTRVKEKTTDS